MSIIVKGGGGASKEQKTVTASTSAINVTPSQGKLLSQVTVNPTPTETKSVTPTTSTQTVTPSSGKHLSSVTVGAVPTEEKTVYFEGSDLEVTPSSGKFLSKVNVTVPVLQSITVTTLPTKTTYWSGDTLNTSGMVVEVSYDNGVTKPITAYICNPTVLDNNTTSITVSYTENNVTKTTSFAVTVKAIVSWANGTDAQIVSMVNSADNGEINLSNYWAVGDIRTITLTNNEQVDLVIMHAGLYDLNTPVASGRTKCSFIVGLKDSLASTRSMNSSNTNSGSWNGCAMRTWINNDFKALIPTSLLPIFKQFKTITAQTYNGSTNQTSIDWFALPAEKEIFGGNTYSNSTEAAALTQFDWYKTSANRVKKVGKTGSADYWWERSPYYNGSAHFCRVYSDGSANGDYASYGNGVSPFGCI